MMCDRDSSEPMNFRPLSHVSFRNSPNLDAFWDLDSIGIKDSPYVTDDDDALARFHDTIRITNGRYEVAWPWKSDDRDLPDNYQLALGRLKSLCRRFQTNTSLLTAYDGIIQHQLANGIIEHVTTDLVSNTPCHYLPHHAVITPSKVTTKLRIVYDASAKIRKNARRLNDCLYRGPVILPDRCGLRLFHAGTSHALAQVRDTYWIPQGRVAVRSILTRCTLCKR